jgi:glycosyltransferase involved in cell wall biosynthesis
VNAARLVSLVVPVYCEQEVLGEFYRRAKAALVTLEPQFAHEIVFVNDGSTDRSLAILREFADRDPCVRIVDLSRNFGHQKAITAGIDHAAGDAVVVIDADLQDPPEVVCEMVRAWDQGFKVVYGVRRRRPGESAFKLVTASLFYRLIARLAEIRLADDSGDFRLMDRAVVSVLKEMREDSRYMRGLVSWVGFSQHALLYEREARYAGRTKYPTRKMVRFAADAITSFSERPLRLATGVGALITAGALALACWVVVGKLLAPERSVQGWTSVIVTVLFLGGVQLLSIGILGEYVGRVYRETKDRPLYVVAERYGFGPRDACRD